MAIHGITSCITDLAIAKLYIAFTLGVRPQRRVKDSNEEQRFFSDLEFLWINRGLGPVSQNVCGSRTLLLHSPSLWSVFSATRISFGFFLPHPLFHLVLFSVLLFGVRGSICGSHSDAFWDDRTAGWWHGQDETVGCDVRAWNPQDDLTHVHPLNNPWVLGTSWTRKAIN